jgi:hypothetical protein
MCGTPARALLMLALILVGATLPAQELVEGRPAVELSGAPAELGEEHGRRVGAGIRLMLSEYIADSAAWKSPEERAEMLRRVRVMKPSLPDWYLTELAACAVAAKVDADMLLYAQCEGDIQGQIGCTSFVAYGDAVAGTPVEMARSFDYWGLKSTHECAAVFAYRPRPEDGYAFVSVGWTGILGGWTFYNEKGLFVANNLGGGEATDPKGIPTLILERILAQQAATVDEAVALVRKLPRMRGQALIIGQAADPARDLPAAAVVIAYDAKTVTVSPATQGLAFDSSIGRRPERVRAELALADRLPMAAIYAVGSSITLHSVTIRPADAALWVAHGRPREAHLGGYARYDIATLLRR